MSKVCVFLADGVEEIEALTVVDILRRGGVTVETVSITDSKSVTSSHKITIQADRLLSEINFDETAMIVLPVECPEQRIWKPVRRLWSRWTGSRHRESI